MEETQALDFYERITQGTEQHKIISLEHKSGATLTNVELHPINKQSLASVIERLPSSMFEAVEGAEDADEAEDEYEDAGGNLDAVTEETVDAFNDLIFESIDHGELTNPQLRHIVDELDFETLFELGTEVINMSVEDTGSIRGFQEQE